jgi:hypothetical protein
MKAKFAVEEELSDPESYICLTEVQKSNYVKAKHEKTNIQKEKNALKYGFEGLISDPESF